MKRPFNPARPRRARRRPPHVAPEPRPALPPGNLQDEAREVLSTARQLVDHYGREAPSVALMRAAEMAAVGDDRGSAAWEAIGAAVDMILAGRPDITGGLN